MRTVSIRLCDMERTCIPIGFVGENLYTRVRIDSKVVFDEYPTAIASLTVQDPNGSMYPGFISRDGDVIIWDVTASDLVYGGNGALQLAFFVDDVIAKSYICRTYVSKAMIGPGTIPTPIASWIDAANVVLGEAEEVFEALDNMTVAAETLAAGSTATAEITDVDGHKHIDFGIPKGDQGEQGETGPAGRDGADGFSPTLVVSTITGGHRITITDKVGTQTVDVLDGEKGETGATGNGIASVVLNQDYTLTITYTNGNSYTTTSIRGERGETGATGQTGATGATPIISIGTVTTGAPGSEASATMDTTDPAHPVLSMSIPEGEPGDATIDDTSTAADRVWSAQKVNELKSAIKLYTEDVPVVAVFNGISSVCGITQITLSENGDSIEIKAKTNISRNNNQFYGFASRGSTKGDISIAIATDNISIRASDDTWVCGKNLTPSTGYRIFKIELKNDTIVTSIDDEVVNTYNGLKTIVINWFGNNKYQGYWAGSVEYVKVNGTKYSLSELPGFDSTDVSYTLPYGLLTEEQENYLMEGSNKNFTIVPSSNQVKVYFRISGDKYGLIEITHEIDHSDANYVDYWRVEDSQLCISYDGLSFTETNDKLLIGAENEMAILFREFDDHVGGWHGDERIDTDNSCYATFIVDGKEHSISDLVTLGQVQCSTFAYREVSILYSPYSYNVNHLKVAKHTKLTTFEKRGFKTKNYVEMDLSDFNQSTLEVGSAYTGLFCIATPFATTVVSDTGTRYTGTHPSTTTVLVNHMDVFDNTAKTYTGNKSCEIDTRLIDTNVESLKGKTNVTIMDRSGDLKYYSYLPNNMNVQTGDYFATEGTVQFMIMEN